jgi:8-oxo-dGTP pyrophosphatase MutT (NUDIX family)
VRHATVLARLSPLPPTLPEPASALTAVLATGGGRRPPVGGPIRDAAVLVLIVPGPSGEARIVLTERVDRGGHHSGEVSFPGGRAEPGDVDLPSTALREAEEEVGLDRTASGVRVVGLLDPVTIPVSAYRVTPVVAVATRRQSWQPQPAEVARVLEPPVEAFLPGAPIVMVERTVGEWPLRYGAYPVEDLLVWGATARILGQLGAVLGWPRA